MSHLIESRRDIVNHNARVMLDNPNLSYYADGKGKLYAVSKWNFLGRVWAWITERRVCEVVYETFQLMTKKENNREIKFVVCQDKASSNNRYEHVGAIQEKLGSNNRWVFNFSYGARCIKIQDYEYTVSWENIVLHWATNNTWARQIYIQKEPLAMKGFNVWNAGKSEQLPSTTDRINIYCNLINYQVSDWPRLGAQ